MPSGKVHSITTVLLAAGTGWAASNAGYAPIITAALTGGTLAGLLLTPDLDVNGGSISNHHARRAGGWVFGMLWAVIWTPYSYAIPHRSPLSHFPLIGTAIRLAYLAAVIWLIMALFHLAGAIALPPLPAWWPWAFAGLALADLLHWVLDHLLRN